MKKETSIKTAYYVISKNPIIIVMVWHLWLYPRIRKSFSESLKGKKAYFILMLWWTSESKFIVSLAKHMLNRYKKKYPEHNFIFLCNSQKEYKLFNKFNLPCIFCNHNALIDEKIFTIMPEDKKRYDAVYNAQMARFKRHKLASKIDNLALITYFDGINSSNFCYNALKKVLSNATWLNKPSSNGNNKYLDPSKVAGYLNQSRVGLCLSAREGTMYASAEYLLCGLPVVSTRSIGGRDVFF